MQIPPEAPWVTDMRDHFYRHGFYRREDLERLLGKPGDSVSVTVNGAVVYRSASGMSAFGQAPQGLEAEPASPAAESETPSPDRHTPESKQ